MPPASRSTRFTHCDSIVLLEADLFDSSSADGQIAIATVASASARSEMLSSSHDSLCASP